MQALATRGSRWRFGAEHSVRLRARTEALGLEATHHPVSTASTYLVECARWLFGRARVVILYTRAPLGQPCVVKESLQHIHNTSTKGSCRFNKIYTPSSQFASSK